MRRLSGLILGLFLFGCMPPNQVSMSLRGRVAFSQRPQPADKAKFRVAMDASDVIAGATISLIDDAKVTIATGLTDANGAFTLTTGAPPTSGTYQLIAAKRVEGNGRLIHLATTVEFDGSTWRSTVDAGPEVIINPASTAVEIVTNAMGLPRARRLGKVGLDAESNEYIALDPALFDGTAQEALLTLTEDVIYHVYDLVDFDIDPLRGVCFVERVVTVEGDKTAGSVGLSRIKITGFGFDPVPERNSIGFQIGTQTIWTPALPGSSTQVLYARVPDLPHPTDGPVVKLNVPVHVRNGVGTLELNAGTPATFNVYFPRRITDPAIKLPDPTTPLTPGSLSVASGNLTGYINLAWRDLRQAANDLYFSPVVRIWDLTANSLASLAPIASDPVLPQRANDPAEMPHVVVHENNDNGMKIMTHLIWQGVNAITNRRAIFHRTADNGVWMANTSPAPGGADAIPTVGGGSTQHAQEPSVAAHGQGLFVAYTQETAGNRNNTHARLWLGGYANGVPDWSSANATSPALLTNTSASGPSARSPQVAVGAQVEGAGPYHVAWFSHAVETPANGDLLYRQGRANVGSTTTLQWSPGTTPMQPAAVMVSGISGFQALTMAADNTNRLVAVWSDSTGLHSKRFEGTLPTNLMQSTGKVDLPPLPGNAAETAPKLVAVGNDDFYLISASTPDGPLGVAGEIWLRRYKANVWSAPIKVHHSPGIPSEQPTLTWNGGNLTAAWLENRTPVVFSIYGSI